MKKLSKIVALLLAGAMAMVMLTACSGGGGGGTQDNSKEEQELMQQIHDKGTSAAKLNNSQDMRRVAADYLKGDIAKAKADIFGHKVVAGVHVDGLDPAEEKEFVTITVTANYEFGGTLLNTMLNHILGDNRVPTNIHVSESGYWTKVGVVVWGDNSQKYAGVSIQVRNPNYPKT